MDSWLACNWEKGRGKESGKGEWSTEHVLAYRYFGFVVLSKSQMLGCGNDQESEQLGGGKKTPSGMINKLHTLIVYR